MSTQNIAIEQSDPEEAHYDSNVYLDYFSQISENCNVSSNEFINEFTQMFNKVYSKHKEGKGRSLLDVGTGRRIWHLASASEKYDNITLAEPLEDNRTMLENFRNASDYIETFKCCLEMVAKQEGKEEKWSDIGKRIRSRTKKILGCDILNKDILGEGKSESEQYDCVMSSLFLEVACTHEENHERAVKKMVSLVKRGGRIVLAGTVNEEYSVHHAGKPMSSCPVLSTMVETWLQKERCAIEYRHTEYFGSAMNGVGCYIVDARKKDLGE